MKKRLSFGAATLGVAATGYATVRYLQTKQRANDKILFGGHVLATSCGSMSYACDGEGPSVLISHAAGGGYDQGQLIARSFNDGSYKIIAPSRFGYTRTPLPLNASPKAQADAYIELLDLLNISRVAIVSLSAGGPSALQFALYHPERCWSLVMISSLSHAVPPLSPIGALLFRASMQSDMLSLVWGKLVADRMFALYGIDPAFLAHIKQDPDKWPLLQALVDMLFPIRLRRAGIINDIEQASAIPHLPLHEIRVPTLVVHGDHDPVVRLSHGNLVARQVPGAEQCTIAGGDHFCLFTHKEQVGPTIADFLHRHAPDE